jgi:hypothetical protein
MESWALFVVNNLHSRRSICEQSEQARTSRFVAWANPAHCGIKQISGRKNLGYNGAVEQGLQVAPGFRLSIDYSGSRCLIMSLEAKMQLY